MQAVQLAEQINDEFLTCKICYEPFKDPKCLSCLHTFCEDCIDQHVSAQRSYKYTDYREFSCPICRKKTVIPTGGVRKLNDNFLVLSLSELLVNKRLTKTPFCEICKIVNNRERDATSKCVECSKLMCRNCVVQHQQMKITNNHNIYELDIEKDILCKTHPNEVVRFYCEACEVCVCVPCTYTEHRDHDLVDFKEGISHHKEKLEDNLKRCRSKIGEIRTRLDCLKQCETRMLVVQNEIHAAALGFIEQIRDKEHSLIDELEHTYGDETINYIKKKDEFETFLDQLKSTTSLADVVVKGKDIEMLILKKQLVEKFEQFEEVQIEQVPKNIFKKLAFVAGSVHLGDIVDPQTQNVDNDHLKTITEDNEDANRTGSYCSSYVDAASDDESRNLKAVEPATSDKSTQITHRDSREIAGDTIIEHEVQTDIRMIHELAPMSHRDRFSRSQGGSNNRSIKMEAKFVQTDPIEINNDKQQANNRPALSSQSSVDDDTQNNAAQNNTPVDMNKLSRRVRRHVKPGCSLAVLPTSSDIVIIDPDANTLTILDKRGKTRYSASNSTVRENYGKLDKGVRFLTPQGMLTIKLENEALHRLNHSASPAHKAYENLPETSA